MSVTKTPRNRWPKAQLRYVTSPYDSITVLKNRDPETEPPLIASYFRAVGWCKISFQAQTNYTLRHLSLCHHRSFRVMPTSMTNLDAEYRVALKPPPPPPPPPPQQLTARRFDNILIKTPF